MKKALFFICLSALATSAQATNGFFSHGIGTQNKGMAGAGVALAGSAAGSALNPAHLALVGSQLEVGVSLFMPDRGFRANADGGAIPSGQYDSKNPVFLIPQVAYNHRIDGESAVGAVTVMNGMNTEYDSAPFENWGGATKPTGTDMYQFSLHVPYARRVTDKLSLGIAPVFAMQAMRFRGFQPLASYSLHPDDVSNNGFDYAFGLGVSGGVHYQVNEQFSLGAGVQSRINMSKFDKYRGLLAEEGNFDMPENFQVGGAFRVTPELTLAADYQQIFYSNVPAIANPNGVLLAPSLLGSDDGLGMGWEDARIIKLGLSWQYDEDTTLRAGYSHGSQIIEGGQGLLNVVAPAVGRDHFSLGLSRQLKGGHEFGLALTYSPEEKVEGTNPNTDPQTGNLQMEQIELDFTYVWRF